MPKGWNNCPSIPDAVKGTLDLGWMATTIPSAYRFISVVIGLSSSSCFFFDKCFCMLFQIQWGSQEVFVKWGVALPLLYESHMRFFRETSRRAEELARWRLLWHLPYPGLCSCAPSQDLWLSCQHHTCIAHWTFSPSPWLIRITFVLLPGFFNFKPRVRKIPSMLSTFSKQIVNFKKNLTPWFHQICFPTAIFGKLIMGSILGFGEYNTIYF